MGARDDGRSEVGEAARRYRLSWRSFNCAFRQMPGPILTGAGVCRRTLRSFTALPNLFLHGN